MLNWTLLFAAYKHASIAVATVTYHVQPFMLVALGALLFGEKLTADRLGWLLLAFAGMVLIVAGRQNGGSGDGYLLGVALALGAALMYAIAAAIVKQLAALPPQLIVLIQLTVGTLALAPFAGWLRRLRPHRLAAAGNPRPGAYRFDVHAAVWRHSEDPHGHWSAPCRSSTRRWRSWWTGRCSATASACCSCWARWRSRRRGGHDVLQTPFNLSSSRACRRETEK